MSTGTDIVQRALQKIGAHSTVSPASAESLQNGFEILNSMISMWLSKGIETGATLLSVIGDELNEKQDCRNAIILNLAVTISPDYDNGKTVVSQTLQAQARVEYHRVTSLYRTFTIPRKVVSSTLPRGQGNKRYTRGDAFFPEGSTIGN